MASKIEAGEYALKAFLVTADEKPIEWDLADVQVPNGAATEPPIYERVETNFKSKPEITYHYRPTHEPIKGVIPLIFSLIVLCVPWALFFYLVPSR